MISVLLYVTKFKTLIIDPPWPYDRASKHEKLSGYVTQDGNTQYATLSIEDLKALPISDVMDAETAYIFLWTVGPFLPDALDCLKAWEFEYKSYLCWFKAVQHPTDPKYFRPSGYGVGYWFRGDHETVLVGKRKGAKSIRTNERSVFSAKRTGHSVKPDNVHKIAEKHFPGPFLEIFGRRPYNGWTVLGNDAPGHEGEDIRDSLKNLKIQIADVQPPTVELQPVNETE
jgi:N6-adenosine-specific RNA methylase IME4